MKQAKRKNLVLDVSNNGGGQVDALSIIYDREKCREFINGLKS